MTRAGIPGYSSLTSGIILRNTPAGAATRSGCLRFKFWEWISVMRVSVLFCILLWLPAVTQAADDTPPPTPASQMLGSSKDLINNLKNIEAYYEAVNTQLNRQLERKSPRDPFEKSEQIQQANEARKYDEATQFIPSGMSSVDPVSLINDMTVSSGNNDNGQQDGGFPRMQYRGFVQQDDEKVGLLDINGIGTFVVRSGDKVGLQQISRDAVINIVEINKLNLIIEVGNFGEKIVVQ